MHQSLRPDYKPKNRPRSSKKIKKVSQKLAKELRVYSELRKEFLSRPENMFCAVYASIPATQVHHSRGRQKYLNDVSTWIAVSDIGHLWIEQNPSHARELGLTKSRLNDKKDERLENDRMDWSTDNEPWID